MINKQQIHIFENLEPANIWHFCLENYWNNQLNDWSSVCSSSGKRISVFVYPIASFNLMHFHRAGSHMINSKSGGCRTCTQATSETNLNPVTLHRSISSRSWSRKWSNPWRTTSHSGCHTNTRPPPRTLPPPRPPPPTCAPGTASCSASTPSSAGSTSSRSSVPWTPSSAASAPASLLASSWRTASSSSWAPTNWSSSETPCPGRPRPPRWPTGWWTPVTCCVTC